MSHIVKCSNCNCSVEYTKTIIVNGDLVCYKCTLSAMKQLHLQHHATQQKRFLNRGRRPSRKIIEGGLHVSR